MRQLKHQEGKSAKITAGCVMVWNQKSKTITVFAKGEIGKPLLWNSDSKRLVPFIRSEQDFINFAMIIADLHQLETKGYKGSSYEIAIEFY